MHVPTYMPVRNRGLLFGVVDLSLCPGILPFQLYYYSFSGFTEDTLATVIAEYPPEYQVNRQQESLAKALNDGAPNVRLSAPQISRLNLKCHFA